MQVVVGYTSRAPHSPCSHLGDGQLKLQFQSLFIQHISEKERSGFNCQCLQAYHCRGAGRHYNLYNAMVAYSISNHLCRNMRPL